MNIDKNSFVTIDYLINLGEGETYPPDREAGGDLFLHGRRGDASGAGRSSCSA